MKLFELLELQMTFFGRKCLHFYSCFSSSDAADYNLNTSLTVEVVNYIEKYMTP